MNISTIILGIISIVLAVAFFFSLDGMKGEDSGSAQKEEIAAIRNEIDNLNAETEALRSKPDPYAYQNSTRNQSAPTSQTPTTTAPPATPDNSETSEVSSEDLAEIERLKKEMASMKEESDTLKEDKEKAERKAEVANKEANMYLGEKVENNDRMERNKRSVETALTLGKVVAYKPEMGFLTFRPAIERAFTRGEKLAIRRNSGILCRATVSGKGQGEVVADVKPSAMAGGMPKIKAGDDIILLPDYYDPPADLSTPPSRPVPADQSAVPAPPTSQPVQEIPLDQ